MDTQLFAGCDHRDGAGRMDFLKRHSDFVTYGIITLVFLVALYQVERDVIGKIQANQIEACERGNALREVVYGNTLQAAKLQPGATYAEQLHILRDSPFIQPDGTIDCLKALE